MTTATTVQRGRLSSETAGRFRMRAALGGGVVAVATAAGALAVLVDLGVALGVVCLPLATFLLTKPHAAAALALALIPLPQPVISIPGLQLAAADILLIVALTGTLLPAAVGGRLRWLLEALAGLRPLLLLYVMTLFIVLIAAFSTASMLGAIQRLQLLIVPTLLGAAVLTRRAARWGALGYLVVSVSLTAALALYATQGGVFGLQKNPLGQFLAGALLLSVAAPRLPAAVRVLAPLFAGGLLLTQSRGAVIGLLAGLLVLVVVTSRSRSRLILLLAPLLVSVVLVFQLLPDDVQARNTEFRSESGTAAAYTIAIRERYLEDALAIISDNPLAGVGINRYLAGSASAGTLTTDPHNVLLLEAAEGGLPLAGALIVLLAGSVVICIRRRKVSDWAAVAAAVQTSTLVHALFDVYWVRATPLLGWFLVGLALSQHHARRQEVDESRA